MTKTELQPDHNNLDAPSPFISPDGSADEGDVATAVFDGPDTWIHSPAFSFTVSEDDALGEERDLRSNPSSVRPEASSVRPEAEKYASIKMFEPWFPKTNPDHPRAKTWRTWKAQREVILWSCLAIISSICLVNFSLATWAWAHFGTTYDGVVEPYQGDCAIVKRANAWAHIVINLIGTLLLSASNLILQLLVAPTRQKIDDAHAKGTWLDIGMPSLRNLRGISRSRAILWSVLAMTSIPIVFLYNSTVFSSLSTNDFFLAVVTEEFLTVPNWTASKDWFDDLQNPTFTIPRLKQKRSTIHDMGDIHGDVTWHVDRINKLYTDYHQNPWQYQNHSVYECLKTYMNPFDWRPVMLIMISSDTESFLHLNSSVLLQWEQVLADSEHYGHPLCGDSSFIGKCASLGSFNSENLGIYDYRGNKIDYVLYNKMDPVQEKMKICYLHGSPQILIVVSLFNLIKCLCIIKVTRSIHGTTLCILGDAIASFVKTPDVTTKGLGTASREEIVEFGKNWSMGEGRLIRWKSRLVRWRHAVSFRRWTFVILVSATIWVASWAVLVIGFCTQRQSRRSITPKSLWARGFGKTSSDQILNFQQPKEGVLGTFVNIMLANFFQVFFSLAYVAWNSFISCMLVADEWCGFAKNRKTLRVSAPVGIQRSSYTLSMPLRYGIPMTIISLLLHWLISQSIFIVRVNKFDYSGDHGRGWTVTGYSFMPSLVAVNLGFLYFIFQILHAHLRKFPDDCAMPLASTCSAAISAACHRPEADTEAHLLPMQWGVVDENRRYCSFTTSRDVVAPTTGSFYLEFSRSSE